MVETGYRQLIIMRHAKTEQLASGDRERKLTERGRADASAAGRWLRDSGPLPDRVLVSPAARARATVDLVLAELATSPEVDVVEGLYAASAQEALQIIADVPEQRRVVLVVGHNPTLEELVHLLPVEPGELMAQEDRHLPTAGIVVLTTAVPWHEITAGSFEVVHRHVARD